MESNDKIGLKDERIHYLLKKEYEKDNLILVDDLYILSLPKVKQAEKKLCLFCSELLTSNEAKEILEFYKNSVESYEISKKVFSRLASKENCAGIIVVFKINAISQSNLEKLNFCLICDGLETPGNIGTIFRTAQSAGVDFLIFTNLRSKVVSDQVVRSSRGMIFYTPFIIFENVEKTSEFLSKNGFRTIICEPEEGTNYKDFNYNNKIALVVGNERYGCSKDWKNYKCEYLYIPMYGEIGSLNVAVAASILIYEAKYQRKKCI